MRERPSLAIGKTGRTILKGKKPRSLSVESKEDSNAETERKGWDILQRADGCKDGQKNTKISLLKMGTTQSITNQAKNYHKI